MAKTQYTKAALKEAIAGKLQRHFACEVKDAKKDQIYEACAQALFAAAHGERKSGSTAYRRHDHPAYRTGGRYAADGVRIK